MTRWPRTRDLPKPMEVPKGALVESVCDRLRKEKQSIGEGEVVLILTAAPCTVTCSDAEKVSRNSMGGTQRHRR